MKRLMMLAALFLLSGLGVPGFAQSQSDGKTFTHGESKRCESLSGAAKEQCDREEATKTEGPAAQETSQPPAAAGKPGDQSAPESPASAGASGSNSATGRGGSSAEKDAARTTPD